MSTERRPRTVITAERRRPGAQLREAWAYRDLLVSFVRRDIALRYRQTALGVVWVVAQPVLGALVLAFVLGRVADLPSSGLPYVPFAFAGMLCWTAVAGTINRSAAALLNQATLITKTYFPRVLLPLSTLGSTLVDLAVGCALLPVFLLAYDVSPGSSLWLFPLLVLGLLALGCGVGLVVAAVVVRFRDVQHVLPVALQLVLLASPVAYGLSAVPAGARDLMELNPLTGLMEACRAALVGTPQPDASLLAYSGSCCLLALALGLVTFTVLERDLADVL